MMLNFYDTILNDNIVPETYEVDVNFEKDKFLVASPGTHYKLDYNPIGEDVIGYTNYLRTNYINTSLHAILALIDTVHCYYDAGHAAIVYGYEEMANGEIFFKCHTGFKSIQVSNITSVYLKLLLNSYEAISLRLTNNVHIHSNSYLYGNSFCPCISNINYSQFSLLDNDEVNYNINNEIWIEKREEEYM